MNVLIAEDDPVSRRLLQSYLDRWGHHCTAAEDGRRAWDLFLAGDFPIVITDWMMPEMDGLELVRRIRGAARPGYVYVILLTAFAEKQHVIQGMEAGADDFVTKPFDREELRVRLGAAERILRLEMDLAEQNRKLRETQAALVQSEKLASLGQLAAGVAHEINNPIAYVNNNLAVLQRDVLTVMDLLRLYRAAGDRLAAALPDVAAETTRLAEEMDLAYTEKNLPRLFQKSLEGLQRVRDIVSNLRDFARLDEAEFKEADLNAALLSTLEIMAHEVKEKSLRIETELGELPLVSCHPGKVNQVFLNVLLNAIQASSPGGLIRVRTRFEAVPPEPLPGAPPLVSGATRGSVVVEVEDTGCGIRPEHLGRIFEPFFTTKPVGQGTGLGLSISYGIVRDHGGNIGVVETAVGRGSTFRVRLPVRPPHGKRDEG